MGGQGGGPFDLASAQGAPVGVGGFALAPPNVETACVSQHSHSFRFTRYDTIFDTMRTMHTRTHTHAGGDREDREGEGDRPPVPPLPPRARRQAGDERDDGGAGALVSRERAHTLC